MKHGLKLEKENWTELLGKEHLRTTSCARCAGLLVSDWLYDLENTGEYHIKVLRCVQCGHRVDPTIVRNRIHPAVPLEYQHSMKPEHLEDAALSF